MTDELERRAGKGPDDDNPDLSGQEADPSDYADPRVQQPGEPAPEIPPDRDPDR